MTQNLWAICGCGFGILPPHTKLVAIPLKQRPTPCDMCDIGDITPVANPRLVQGLINRPARLCSRIKGGAA